MLSSRLYCKVFGIVVVLVVATGAEGHILLFSIISLFFDFIFVLGVSSRFFYLLGVEQFYLLQIKNNSLHTTQKCYALTVDVFVLNLIHVLKKLSNTIFVSQCTDIFPCSDV